MKEYSKNVFEMFVKPIRRLIERRGFKEPTEPQKKVMPLILEGKNVLLSSPTATGKTEAAVLPVLNILVKTPEQPHGIKILYITPLRALNRDLLERLEWWCDNLDVKLAVRHGDTESRERRGQALSPPEMLITTPETLQAILTGRRMRQHLKAVRFVIVDEVHEIADNKRGSQLSLALERLRWVTGRDFQLIGLSATIGSPEKVAQFLVGAEREVSIVKVPVARLMKLKILFPKPGSSDYELASALFTHPEVAARLRVIRRLVEKHNSVLLFTNTRAISEVLTSRFKVWDIDFPVSIHHGSLAKTSRVAAERGLKEGRLKGLVATSSLELGIDVGRIDLTIQYMSPRQVTRLIQRVGRSGHRIGRIAKGVIVTMDSDDTLEAMVIARRAYKEELEPVDIPAKPYDVLTHQIAGVLMKRKSWGIREICEFMRKSYPYANLTSGDTERVLMYMHNRFPRLVFVSLENSLVTKPFRTKALYDYYFENLSMIPYKKQFLTIEESSNMAVGILDEAFVAEHGKPGVKFIISGSSWEILKVHEDHVYVKSIDDPTGAIPSWAGEELPVPFEVAQEVGCVRGFIEDQMKSGAKPEEVAFQLSERYPLDSDAILRAISEIIEHFRKGHRVPTDKRITIEDWKDFVVIQASFGSLTNRSLAQLIGHMLSERTGYSVVVQHDPYRIFIKTAGTAEAEHVMQIVGEIGGASDQIILNKLTKATVKTGLFKRRMIHVARRFGALEIWADFSKISLQSLMKSFKGTVIYDEAIKETFTKDLDLNHTLQILNQISIGKIEIVKLEDTQFLSPIARIGAEKARMKSDLIPPERMRVILTEAAKARLLSEARTLVCTNRDCLRYVETIRTKDLPDKPVCPLCETNALGVLEEEERAVQLVLGKDPEKMTKKERDIWKKALETAKLMAEYGKVAAVALNVHRLKVKDVKKILQQESKLSSRFYELILEAERRVLRKRF